ncbi:hypothetical protein ColLi_02740 [Colletotrichum liriopes]|uniref:Uncharacterized protein n=1 Tax=Colletotrichum liriopes TaxID=708192 RepID=A0AA37LQ10_9PEZI|nr:hypothetical protein ColLi_02740 [Colletotrichum liriopes]
MGVSQRQKARDLGAKGLRRQGDSKAPLIASNTRAKTVRQYPSAGFQSPKNRDAHLLASSPYEVAPVPARDSQHVEIRDGLVQYASRLPQSPTPRQPTRQPSLERLKQDGGAYAPPSTPSTPKGPGSSCSQRARDQRPDDDSKRDKALLVVHCSPRSWELDYSPGGPTVRY